MAKGMSCVSQKKLQRILFVIIIVGTGLFLGVACKEYQMISALGRQCGEILVEKGYSGNSVIQYLGEKQKIKKQTKFSAFLKNVTVVSYLMKQGDSLKKINGEDAKSLVSVFSGKSAKEPFWSGASMEREKESELFAISDLTESLQAQKENKEYIKLFPADKVLGESKKEKSQAVLENKNAVQRTKLEESRNVLRENRKILQRVSNGEVSRKYLLKKLYIVDSTTSISPRVFDMQTLLGMNLKMKKENKPQILIYHTHGASESFVGSRKGKREDGVIGVGSVLAKILSEKYGYNVIHDETPYDLIHGRIDRSRAYVYSCEGVERTLKKYPSIKVIIDLHRDGVGNKVHRLTTIRGERTAQVMFFNGVSRNRKGKITYLENRNLQGNLAFSLQAKLACMKKYPDFAKPIYLKGYRYNLHLRKRAMLIELGNENNTLKEAKNAMEPLADVLNEVLSVK